MSSDSTTLPPEDSVPDAAGPPGATSTLGPALGSARIVAIDILRGLAVLGILAMNIYAFAMPMQAYNNPLAYGGDSGLNLWVWFFTHVVFDQKFLPIFSMLFGAGLALMYDRAESRGQKLAGVYYRRSLWLMLFGMAHAYFIWWGDILFFYGGCGLVLFLFRKLKPKTLLIVGACVFMMGVPINIMSAIHFAGIGEQVKPLEVKKAEGGELTEEETTLLEQWEQMRPMMEYTAEDIREGIELYRDGSYGEIFVERAKFVVFFQIGGFFSFALWRPGGLMLIGMALLRLGVFSAGRSRQFYWRLLACGYGIGLPMVLYSAFDLSRHQWDGFYFMQYAVHWNYIGSIGVALGHVSVLMLMIQSQVMPQLLERLQAVGRMAFTNYLAHSVVMTTIFYSYGFGLFGEVGRFAQMGFVVLMWVAQLLWSPIWLRHFRFGPAEWLWRSLTYWKLQPFRRQEV